MNKIIIYGILTVGVMLAITGLVLSLEQESVPESTEDQDFLPIEYNNTKPVPITNCVDADGNEIQESYQTKCHPLFQP